MIIMIMIIIISVVFLIITIITSIALAGSIYGIKLSLEVLQSPNKLHRTTTILSALYKILKRIHTGASANEFVACICVFLSVKRPLLFTWRNFALEVWAGFQWKMIYKSG